MLVLFGSTGCSSLQPFRQTVQPKLAAAKQWTKGGIEALHSGRIAQAKSFFSRAADENPRDPVAHANLARTELQAGDTGAAIAHMQTASNLAAGDPRLIVELGEMQLAAGQWLAAKRQSEIALEINHRFAPAWKLNGETNLAKGDFELALADFQRAAGIDSTVPGLQLSIIETYQKLGQPLRALSAAEQLLSQYPPDQQPEPALLAKSVALMELKQISPAIDILQAASDREAAGEQVYLRLSQAQLLAGQPSAARLTLTRAKIAHPRQPQFDVLLSQLQSDPTHVAAN
jgi:tetratricopeptide (TPR) repeat protein